MLAGVLGAAAASSDKPGPAKGPNGGAWRCFCGHFAATSGGFPVRLRDVGADGWRPAGQPVGGIGRRGGASAGFPARMPTRRRARLGMRRFRLGPAASASPHGWRDDLIASSAGSRRLPPCAWRGTEVRRRSDACRTGGRCREVLTVLENGGTHAAMSLGVTGCMRANPEGMRQHRPLRSLRSH